MFGRVMSPPKRKGFAMYRFRVFLLGHDLPYIDVWAVNGFDARAAAHGLLGDGVGVVSVRGLWGRNV